MTHISLHAPLAFCVIYSSFFELLMMNLAALNILLCSKVCGEVLPLFLPGYKCNYMFFLNCRKGDKLDPLSLVSSKYLSITEQYYTHFFVWGFIHLGWSLTQSFV